MYKKRVKVIDVSKMSMKELMNVLDPSGNMYKEHIISNIIFWGGTTIVVSLYLIVLYIGFIGMP